MENQTHTIQEPTAPQVAQQPMPELTDKQMLAEIYENTRKTKNYMKWQLIITVALVVLPLIATLILIPFMISTLSSVYGGAASGVDSSSVSELQNLLQ